MRTAGSKVADDDNAVEQINRQLYDKLERALIALQYALADARSCQLVKSPELGSIVRSHEALQNAGDEVRDVLLVLKSTALQSAAERVRRWG